MNITKADIDKIPQCWANEAAEDCDPDWFLHYGCAYVTLRACWPECREVVEAMLTDLLTLESNYAS
jgi:hypothetical protein